MLKIDFTAEESTELLYWKEHHPHPRVRKKMSVLYLKSQKISHKEIKRLERISECTLLKYLREYQQPNGLEELKKVRFYQPKSDLEAHAEALPLSSNLLLRPAMKRLQGSRNSQV